MTNHPNRSKKSVLAWHFLAEKKLANGDGRTVKVGKKLTVEGQPNLCSNGLHGSIRLIDALDYAQGSILCRVRHSGIIVKGDDKLCSTERTVLWMGDIETILHNFACDEAEMALEARRKAGDTVDPRSTAAIQAKRDWLKGKITDAQLAAAWDAARSAAAASRAAAWAAARAAAWAAWDAERAAGAAAVEAERAAVEAARAAQKEVFAWIVSGGLAEWEGR